MALTVLVADNDQTSLELITAVLTRDGYNVVSTPDGGDALSRFLEHQPALVVCAESLPSLPAAQLCKQIKAQSDATRVVVLATDGEVDAARAELKNKLGCDAVIGRPFKYSSLKEALTGWGILAPVAEPAPVMSFSVPIPEIAVPDVGAMAPAPLLGEPSGAGASGDMIVPIPLPVGESVGAGPVVMTVPDVVPAEIAAAVPAEVPAMAAAEEESVPDVSALLDGAAMEMDGIEAPESDVAPAVRHEVEVAAAAVAAAPSAPEPELDFDAVAAAPPAPEPELDVDAVAAAPPAPEPELDLDAVAAAPPAPEPELDVDAVAAVPPAPEPELDVDAVAAAPPAPEPELDLEAVVAAPPAPEPELDLDAVAAAPPAPEPELDLEAASPPPEPEPELDLDAMVAQPAPAAASSPVVALELDVPPAPTPTPSSDSPLPTNPAPSASEPTSRDPGALPPSIPRYGDLGTMPLPRLLFELYCATFSGILRVARHGMKRAIYLWGGLPVRVDTDQASEGLARMLIEHGRITEAQLTSAGELAQKNHWTEGEALVELGALRRAELLDALRELTEQRLAASFGWRDGTYRVDLDQSFRDRTVMTEVHPLKAIFRGVREHYDLVSLLTYFANLRGRYVVATELFGVHFETLGPFLRDLDIVSLLDGATTFEDALRSDDRRAMELAQALYVLLVTDMVRPAQKPGAAASSPQKRSREPERAVHAVDYREMTRLCDDIAREYLRIKEGDLFEILRIDDGATAAEVDAAHDNLVRPYLADTLPPGLPDDAQRRAREICEALGRARTVARDDMLKERYIASQRAKYQNAPAAAPKAAPVALAAAGQELELADDRPLTSGEDRAVAERAFVEAQRLVRSQPALARQKLEAAVRLSPNEPGYRALLAQVMLSIAPRDAENRRAAAEQLKQALELDPSHIDANFEMARLLASFGKPDNARSHLTRILQRAPQHRDARALLSRLDGEEIPGK